MVGTKTIRYEILRGVQTKTPEELSLFIINTIHRTYMYDVRGVSHLVVRPLRQ